MIFCLNFDTYFGYIKKLAKPIELKGRIIRYKPVAKLVKKTGKKSVVKKSEMRGGYNKGETDKSMFFISTSTDYKFLSNFYPCEFTDNEELNNSGNQIVFKNVEQYFMYQIAKMFDKNAVIPPCNTANIIIIIAIFIQSRFLGMVSWNIC